MATSKNIQSINEVAESQQAYTTVLYGHINTLYTKLVQLDKQVQIHCIYPHPQSDVIQLNAPDYDPYICRATTRPPRPSSTAECLCLIARLREEQASAASWEPRPPFEAAEMD